MKLTRNLLLALAACLTPLGSHAAPMHDELLDFEQPDGTAIQLKVTGDFYAHFETPDGYAVVQDPDSQYFTYAELSADGQDLIPTFEPVGLTLSAAQAAAAKLKPRRPRPAQKGLRLPPAEFGRRNREAAAALEGPGGPIDSRIPVTPGVSQRVSPLAGAQQINGLCILIYFPNVSPTIPRAEVDDFCNKTGYSSWKNNGSVRDYFLEASGGKVNYRNQVTTYYRARNPRSYYTDPNVSFGIRAQELVYEALNHLEAQGFDFSTLSVDANGSVRAVNFFYAGPLVNRWAKGLWPHTYYWIPPFSADGVTVSSYQMTNMGTSLKLGMFCHENGHLLFRWPDLYDYGFESGGIGNYCLMASSGGINPNLPNPWLRHEAGWIQPVDINDAHPGTVFDVAANTIACYRYVNKTAPREAFYIEAHKRVGRRTLSPSQGLAIWHFDRYGNQNYEQRTPAMHYQISLEQADGKFDLESKLSWGDANDLYRAGYKTEFADHTLPDSKWWSGRPSGLWISAISPVQDLMHFTIGGPAWTATATLIPALTRTPTQEPSAEPTAAVSPSSSSTPSATSSRTPTHSPSSEPSAEPTGTASVSSTETRTPAPASTSTPMPTQEASNTSTPSPSATASATPTQTSSPLPTQAPTVKPTPRPMEKTSVTATATSTVSPSSTPSPSSTFSPTPTSAQTPETPTEPTTQPSTVPTPSAAGDCPAFIDRLMVSPNPSTAAADRMVSLKLACPADRVKVEVFSVAMAPLFAWEVADIHVERGQWVHLKYPHGVELANGTYYVRATAYRAEDRDSRVGAFVVMK